MNKAASEIQALWDRQDEAERRGVFDKRSSTYVYVIAEAGTSRPVKIGIAEDTDGRARSLQCGNPRPLEVRASYLVSSRRAAAYIEESAHDHFAGEALHGEWFDIGVEDAAEYLSAKAAETEGKSRGNRRFVRLSRLQAVD